MGRTRPAYMQYWLYTVFSVLGIFIASANAQQAGSVRGMVYDADFEAPLAAAQVTISETGESVVSTDAGNYVFGEVKPGTYTLVFSKDGYVRQVKANVVVSEGQMTEMDASLAGDFTEMEEFVVQDLQIGAGSEAALLDLRLESPAMMDSIGSELMSRAGAGDAAAALNLIAGATVSEGKYATIRGLPDRYVNSQMNGVRLPTADADKRAVELDQFPAAIIESIQISKTFTPDQQGDASGGAVNVVLKGIPQERVIKFSGQTSWNTNVMDADSDFLSYKGGGVNTWGKDDGGRDIPDDLNFNPTAGVSTESAPELDYKGSFSAGDKWNFEKFKIGAFGSYFYERSNSYYDDGIKDRYWVIDGKDHVEPKAGNGVSIESPGAQTSGAKTSLFDVTQATEEVKWGGLGAFGFETEKNSLNLVYLYTRSAEDKAILAEDTRGKELFFPGYDVDDPLDDGNRSESRRNTGRYLRNETLQYTERTTDTLQFSGKHTLPDLELGPTDVFSFHEPLVDWTVSQNSATLDQPDKRYFAASWKAPRTTLPAVWTPEAVGNNIELGNYQRVWKNINEDSDQYAVNLKLPFEQWSGDEGYLKFGFFDDQAMRTYEQESFSNDGYAVERWLDHGWDEFWSEEFHNSNPDNLPEDSNLDVDYDGEQSITAWYYMADVPLNSWFNVIGGVRFEDTEISTTTYPETFDSIPLIGKHPDDGSWVEYRMQPDDKGDVDYKQQDTLPMGSFVFRPWESVTARASYAETIARPTFKELSPVAQQEYPGGDTFVGNPDLTMAALDNYDLRLDWEPYDGGLLSGSWFHKDIEDTIEYVTGYASNTGEFTIPVNYPEGKIDGYELEFRQKLGNFWESLEGLSAGANATLIESQVTLPDDEYQRLQSVSPARASKTRDMVNTPEHLFNYFVTYDIEKTGTQMALFYTIRGDTLVTGTGVVDAEANRNIIPDIYETEYGTLNFSISQKMGEIWVLKFQAKNLLDPEIESVYRDPIDGDIRHSSYTKGLEFAIGLSATF